MIIAAVNTASDYLSFAIGQYKSDPASEPISRLLGSSSVHLTNRKHSELFFSQFNQVLGEFKKCPPQDTYTLNSIDLFVALCGPGSYTGIRIGVSAFSGIASGLNRPFITLSNLSELAYQAAAQIDKGTILSIYPANYQEFYWAIFQKDSHSAYPTGLQRITEDRADSIQIINQLVATYPSPLFVACESLPKAFTYPKKMDMVTVSSGLDTAVITLGGTTFDSLNDEANKDSLICNYVKLPNTYQKKGTKPHDRH